MKKLSAPSGMAFAVILSVPLWAMIMLVTYVCLFATGCTITIPDINLPDDPVSPLPPIVVTTTTTTTTIPPSDSEIDLSKVKWLGKNYAGCKLQDGILKSASINGGTIHTSYNPYSWPVKFVKTDCDAIVCLFYRQGNEIVGGKFDWWRKGGQSSKGLENVIHKKYGGHSMPVKGTDCWEMIVSTDEKLRSNIVKVTWK